MKMAQKRYWDEDALKLLREIDVHLHDDLDVVIALQRSTSKAWCGATTVSNRVRYILAQEASEKAEGYLLRAPPKGA